MFAVKVPADFGHDEIVDGQVDVGGHVGGRRLLMNVLDVSHQRCSVRFERSQPLGVVRQEAPCFRRIAHSVHADVNNNRPRLNMVTADDARLANSRDFACFFDRPKAEPPGSRHDCGGASQVLA